MRAAASWAWSVSVPWKLRSSSARLQIPPRPPLAARRSSASFRSASISGNTVAFTAVPGSSPQSVYTASLGLAGASLIAQPGTSAGADGVFQSGISLGPVSAISGSNIVFVGSTSAGGQGVYAGAVGSTGALSVANNLTPWPPNPSLHLNGFQGGPSVSGNKVVFACSGISVSGIFTATIGSSGVSVIADRKHTGSRSVSQFQLEFCRKCGLAGDQRQQRGVCRELVRRFGCLYRHGRRHWRESDCRYHHAGARRSHKLHFFWHCHAQRYTLGVFRTFYWW